MQEVSRGGGNTLLISLNVDLKCACSYSPIGQRSEAVEHFDLGTSFNVTLVIGIGPVQLLSGFEIQRGQLIPIC